VAEHLLDVVKRPTCFEQARCGVVAKVVKMEVNSPVRMADSASGTCRRKAPGLPYAAPRLTFSIFQ
jgi:hypothetical protein